MTQQLKLSIFIGILLLISMIVYLNWNSSSNLVPTVDVDNSVPTIKAETIASTQSISEPNSNIQQSAPDVNQQSAQVDEVLAWQTTRGWYDNSQDTQDDYKAYTESTLKQLAENGDLKALHLLAYSAPLEESKQLLTKAAIYGSSRALFNLADNVIISNSVYKDTSEEKKRPVLSEAAAYIQVATMRGDLLNAKYISSVSSLETQFNFKFSDTDLEQANLRAQDIYHSLESQRIALGLGQFDNSIPPAIKVYFRASGVEVAD